MTRPRSLRLYPPLAVTSHDGRWRFDAEPAQNGGVRSWFASGIRYAYVLRKCTAITYRRTEYLDAFHVERSGACPWAAWVHVDGVVAVLHADDELVLFDANGSVTGDVNVLRELERKGEVERPIRPGGTFWTTHPIGRWIDVAGVPRFRLILPNGKRIHFNVDGSPDEAGVPEEAQENTSWLMCELRRALDAENFLEAGELARLAGREGHEATVPLLLELNRSS